MALNNSKLKRDLEKLAISLKKNLNYTDFNKEPSNDNSFIVQDGTALRQAFNMWLRSNSTDYIRVVNKSGFFYNALRDYPFLETSIPIIKRDITAACKNMFPNIKIIELEVERKQDTRAWIVRLSIQDELTGIFDLAEEIESFEV